MHAGKDPHRHVTRIVADEHFVDFEDRAELAIQGFGRDVGQVEIDLVLAADAFALDANLEDFARRDVARDEVAVRRILLFEKIKTLLLGNC